jgi:hypothetical protein
MFLRVLFALSTLGAAALAQSDGVHLSYHWHLHQPIYWPETAPGVNRYQFARESIDLKFANSGNFYGRSSFKHPRNALVSGDGGEFDSVFDKDDPRAACQARGKDAIASMTAHQDAGASGLASRGEAMLARRGARHREPSPLREPA